MKRNPEHIASRRDFINMAIDDPAAAASRLRCAARQLEKANNITELVSRLSRILHVSESTIFKDLKEPGQL